MYCITLPNENTKPKTRKIWLTLGLCSHALKIILFQTHWHFSVVGKKRPMQGWIWQETLSNEIHEVSKFGAPSKALAAQASRGFAAQWKFSGRFHSSFVCLFVWNRGDTLQYQVGLQERKFGQALIIVFLTPTQELSSHPYQQMVWLYSLSLVANIYTRI